MSNARARIIAAVGGTALGALLATTRFEVSGREQYEQFTRAGQPVIFVLWHGRLLPSTYLRRGEGMGALISQHRDGEYIARIAAGWGFHPIRGSSSRGGTAALRELVREVKHGRSLAITPDGPRGPRERMKPGALVLAQLTGAPVVPAASGCQRAWWFGSWDRFLVPKPFSTVRVAYGESMRVPRDLDEARLEVYQRELEDRLTRLTRSVDGP
jgi:lysophospholipid acyltransferase (LPLAT)-like uncharacterized protein